MAKNNGFVEVSYDSRTDWTTFRQVAELLGLRVAQVTGWARSGHIVSCKVKGKRFISLSECQEYKTRAHLQRPHTKKRSRSKDTKTQEPQPLPEIQPEPIRCEVVPIQVGGAELVGIRLDGQEVIAAQLLEKILQLQPRSISGRVGRDEWFVIGEDYVVLRGRHMRALREKVVDVSPTTSLLKAPHLMILTEDGVTKVLTTIRSRVTDVLATTLLKSNFMRRAARAVMHGDGEGFARNAADDATDALAKLRLFVTTELSEMQGHLAAVLEENQDLRQQLDENTYKLDMVDKRLVHMPDDVARSLAPMIADMARNARYSGPSQRDRYEPRQIKPGEDPFYHPRLSSSVVAGLIRGALPRCDHSRISTQSVNAAGKKMATAYWKRRGRIFINQDTPGFIEKGPSVHGREKMRYWYSEAFALMAVKHFRSGQTDLFDGDQP